VNLACCTYNAETVAWVEGTVGKQDETVSAVISVRRRQQREPDSAVATCRSPTRQEREPQASKRPAPGCRPRDTTIDTDGSTSRQTMQGWVRTAKLRLPNVPDKVVIKEGLARIYAQWLDHCFLGQRRQNDQHAQTRGSNQAGRPRPKAGANRRYLRMHETGCGTATVNSKPCSHVRLSTRIQLDSSARRWAS